MENMNVPLLELMENVKTRLRELQYSAYSDAAWTARQRHPKSEIREFTLERMPYPPHSDKDKAHFGIAIKRRNWLRNY